MVEVCGNSQRQGLNDTHFRPSRMLGAVLIFLPLAVNRMEHSFAPQTPSLFHPQLKWHLLREAVPQLPILK